jgi:hypothetical protein
MESVSVFYICLYYSICLRAQDVVIVLRHGEVRVKMSDRGPAVLTGHLRGFSQSEPMSGYCFELEVHRCCKI